jgi:uncharacterized protein YbjT (DUF2867 family)
MLIWVSPVDIAVVAAEELQTSNAVNKIRYIASDELTGSETARILGEAIGKPDLKWILIPGEQMKNGLIAVGMNAAAATGMVEMFASQHAGALTEDFYRRRPEILGSVKLKDFAKEFAATYKKG